MPGPYRIPTDRPLVTQISRFDRWKDPMGVIEAFHKAREQVDCTLVLLGNTASDDPEGEVMLETIRNSIDERVIVLTADDPLLVNALQRRAAVVLQKSTREGFGLTVTEAMWKGAAVIGGNVGGIRRQIRDGENGFLVNTVDQASDRIVQCPARSRAAPADRRAGAGDGAREVPHEPPAGGLARSARRPLATGAANGRCALPRSRRWPRAFRPSSTAAPNASWRG